VRFAAASDDFCAALLKECGVLLAPGRLFGAAAPHFRIGFGRRDFEPGLKKLSRYVEQMPRG
jgi:aspartate/methionine/tyrosine aminotransferase